MTSTNEATTAPSKDDYAGCLRNDVLVDLRRSRQRATRRLLPERSQLLENGRLGAVVAHHLRAGVAGRDGEHLVGPRPKASGSSIATTAHIESRPGRRAESAPLCTTFRPSIRPLTAVQTCLNMAFQTQIFISASPHVTAV
jgi:hypothetical protein